ncbi:DsrE family protein [uncultured Lentibacter sp.]|uniref:DsrE family protein n=1 Tax=uncultured Lentibacter sp. TaxID=1659309 RepID=UPI002613BE07|nr:DsrE family protein [uncultured Lentibacter sp.]
MRQMLSSLFALFFLASPAFANTDVDALLTSNAPPVGVVFEVVQGDTLALSWALPQIRAQTARLKARFPTIKIAVVTHGNEQFSLMQGQSGAKAQQIQKLAQKFQASGVPLHVCGGYAQTQGVSAQAFPDYVDVAASGPGQIGAYRAQGYALVIVEKP